MLGCTSERLRLDNIDRSVGLVNLLKRHGVSRRFLLPNLAAIRVKVAPEDQLILAGHKDIRPNLPSRRHIDTPFRSVNNIVYDGIPGLDLFGRDVDEDTTLDIDRRALDRGTHRFLDAAARHLASHHNAATIHRHSLPSQAVLVLDLEKRAQRLGLDRVERYQEVVLGVELDQAIVPPVARSPSADAAQHAVARVACLELCDKLCNPLKVALSLITRRSLANHNLAILLLGECHGHPEMRVRVKLCGLCFDLGIKLCDKGEEEGSREGEGAEGRPHLRNLSEGF
mmetsp:Transcript_1984/g.4818  ORF Transcript_1984/g.4818 Transcript_1984/m.4818 type:complete len:284 (-) Transcript_1984:820-1671(-)